MLNGWDSVPGTTITRYCSSSVQTTRMAFHAIRAGEGEVYVSAGVETVSRYGKGNSDNLPDTMNPAFTATDARTEEDASTGRTWHDPRLQGELPNLYLAMGQTAENVASLKGICPQGDGRVRGPVAEPGGEGNRQWLLGKGDHPRHHAGRNSRDC